VKRAAAVVVALFAASAGAAPVTVSDDDLRWQLDLPDHWSTAELPEVDAGRPLASFASGGRRLVVLRIRGNTDGAFDGKASFFAGLEDGVRRELGDYVRVSAKTRKVGKKKLPAYDLWYRTGDGTRGARFIFLRNYCILATIDLPGEKPVPKDARRILESLQPAF